MAWGASDSNIRFSHRGRRTLPATEARPPQLWWLRPGSIPPSVHQWDAPGNPDGPPWFFQGPSVGTDPARPGPPPWMLFYFGLCWVPTPAVVSRGYSWVVLHRLLIVGTSLAMEFGLWGTETSVIMAPGLQSTGSTVGPHGLSGSKVWEVFLEQGLNPRPLHWQADSYPPSAFRCHAFAILFGLIPRVLLSHLHLPQEHFTSTLGTLPGQAGPSHG